MDRRTFLKYSGASLAIWPSQSVWSNNLDHGAQQSQKKFIFVLLRGALDSLHTIIPNGDKNFVKHRPKLSKVKDEGGVPLNSQFTLHPELTTLARWYKEKTLAPIVAVGSGYPSRSHFDGQDYLESGLTEFDHMSGWLGRAISRSGQSGIAISQTMPIVFRSATEVKTWYPSNLKSADADIFDNLSELYQKDSVLSEMLQDGIKTKDLVKSTSKKTKNKNRFVELASSCGQLMSVRNGPDCALLEIGGWDTHNNQMNRLSRKLKELDSGLDALQKSLGDTWRDTVVVVATEFGRTVRENGTGGTDHGTGSCMFVAGGQVAGGQVLGQWPGLSSEHLFENRDLAPTTNHFSWFSAILSEHWGLTIDQLNDVFPNHSPYVTQIFNKPTLNRSLT